MPNKIKIVTKDIQFMFRVIVSMSILIINSFKISKELYRNFAIINFYLFFGRFSIFIEIEEFNL